MIPFQDFESLKPQNAENSRKQTNPKVNKVQGAESEKVFHKGYIKDD